MKLLSTWNIVIGAIKEADQSPHHFQKKITPCPMFPSEAKRQTEKQGSACGGNSERTRNGNLNTFIWHGNSRVVSFRQERQDQMNPAVLPHSVLNGGSLDRIWETFCTLLARSFGTFSSTQP